MMLNAGKSTEVAEICVDPATSVMAPKPLAVRLSEPVCEKVRTTGAEMLWTIMPVVKGNPVAVRVPGAGAVPTTGPAVTIDPSGPSTGLCVTWPGGFIG
jgi:hypothetical protein